MLFNSYTFFVFFAIVLVGSRQIRNWQARKLFLLIASYAFYAAWNPPFVLLLWISTLTDWFAARGLYASQTQRRRRLFLLLSLVVNLGMLSYFKYAGFVMENINALLSALGVSYSFDQPGIILPVGISFYTFQTLSYTIDIYRGKMKPWHSFLDYALYVTFFPQLVAGPIVRASEFLPQCVKDRVGTREQIGWGLSLFTIGLFFKVVIADVMVSPIVELVFDSSTTGGFLTSWTGALAFSIQIFCDFFGYSTCAIGVALCLGFVLPDNFHSPYAALGFSDFWRRWHITLSTWLRDYLYIPLGGNRKGTIRTYVNLMITMLLGGLWHGASWMFVIWGGLHGLYLAVERLLSQIPIIPTGITRRLPARLLLILLTYVLVCVAWVFFRAPDMTTALGLCKSMLDVRPVVHAILQGQFSLDAIEGMNIGRNAYLTIGVLTSLLLGLHFVLRDSSIERLFERMSWWMRASVLAAMLFLTLISMSGEDNAFIYFQF